METNGGKNTDLILGFVLVAVGGAIGAVLRFAVSKTIETEFPWSTFIVNIIGCTLAAFVLFSGMNETARVFIVVGIFGAFTTLSAFSNETISMLADQEYLKATGNFFLNIIVCLLGGILGRYLAISL